MEGYTRPPAYYFQNNRIDFCMAVKTPWFDFDKNRNAYSRFNPHQMIQTINSFFILLAHWIEGIFSLIVSAIPEPKQTEYDADFFPASEMLSRFNKGFTINGRSLTLEDSFKNILVTAQTGAGKSSCICIPTCFNLIGNASFCVNDPSGEIAEKVTGALMKAGYDIKIINYTKPGFGGFNPLRRVKNRSDAQKISEQIIYTALGRGGKDPFWNVSASSCLSLFVELACSLPEEQRTMSSVIQMINTFSYNPEAIDKLVVRAKNPVLLQEYKVFVSYDPKVVQSVIATVKAATKIFSDPFVAVTTAYDSIDFEACRKMPTAIFFNNSVTNMKYFGVITSIFFEQFFAEILSRIPDKKELPVFFLIDEASSLYLNSLQTVCSNIRKSRAGLMAIFQSYHQVVSMYGSDDANAIRENCFTSVYLPGQPLDVCKELSTVLGSFQFTDDTGNKHTRLLLTPSEVHEMEEALVLCGNKRAIRLPMRPYYESTKLQALSTLKPYQPPQEPPFTTPPPVQFPSA